LLKAKIHHLRRLHSKVDDAFLDNRIAPRLIVIIAEGVKFEFAGNKSWDPKRHSNITININKYIAKYDYDVAMAV
jgi:hypothetical protein